MKRYYKQHKSIHWFITVQIYENININILSLHACVANKVKMQHSSSQVVLATYTYLRYGLHEKIKSCNTHYTISMLLNRKKKFVIEVFKHYTKIHFNDIYMFFNFFTVVVILKNSTVSLHELVFLYHWWKTHYTWGMKLIYFYFKCTPLLYDQERKKTASGK